MDEYIFTFPSIFVRGALKGAKKHFYYFHYFKGKLNTWVKNTQRLNA